MKKYNLVILAIIWLTVSQKLFAQIDYVNVKCEKVITKQNCTYCHIESEESYSRILKFDNPDDEKYREAIWREILVRDQLSGMNKKSLPKVCDMSISGKHNINITQKTEPFNLKYRKEAFAEIDKEIEEAKEAKEKQIEEEKARLLELKKQEEIEDEKAKERYKIWMEAMKQSEKDELRRREEKRKREKEAEIVRLNNAINKLHTPSELNALLSDTKSEYYYIYGVENIYQIDVRNDNQTPIKIKGYLYWDKKSSNLFLTQDVLEKKDFKELLNKYKSKNIDKTFDNLIILGSYRNIKSSCNQKPIVLDYKILPEYIGKQVEVICYIKKNYSFQSESTIKRGWVETKYEIDKWEFNDNINVLDCLKID